VRLVADLDFETIKFEQRDKTACITFNRPHALNSINVQMMKELAVAYQHVEDSKEIWTLIVTGEGRAFCTGADVSMIDNTHIDGKPTGIDLWGEPILNNLRQWETPQEATPPYMTMTKPIICALNGMAAGAGLDLVTCSDIVIAADDCSFFDPHVSIGLVSGREMVRMARVLPLNITMRMALMGKHERLSAQRAYDLGLVSELTPKDKLMERAWEIADTVNLNAPLAVRGTRMGIRKGLSLPVYQAEFVAESYRIRVAQTKDGEEGTNAFLEKRKPVWRGE
jgi:enoyl-CoA hydratase/carnithine racemase